MWKSQNCLFPPTEHFITRGQLRCNNNSSNDNNNNKALLTTSPPKCVTLDKTRAMENARFVSVRYNYSKTRHHYQPPTLMLWQTFSSPPEGFSFQNPRMKNMIYELSHAIKTSVKRCSRLCLQRRGAKLTTMQKWALRGLLGGPKCCSPFLLLQPRRDLAQ